ncbi:MAG: aminotransferase class IV [Gallicola sp.]|nr:aminotransferase class IV [Gallicola sp.]
MKIHIDDGFRFGIGVFETILLLENQPIFLEEHLKRLKKSASHFQLEGSMDQDQIFDFLKGENVPGKSVLKITITSENLLLERKEYSYGEEDFIKGFSLIESSVLRNESSPFTYHKTLNYGDNIIEKRKAVSADYNEPYFANTKGNIAEGATTNLFFIKGNNIVTPPVSSGLLNGILREWVVENYKVIESEICKKDYNQFDEIFLTNSLLGIMPVRSINNYELPSMRKSFSLHKEYENFIKNKIR